MFEEAAEPVEHWRSIRSARARARARGRQDGTTWFASCSALCLCVCVSVCLCVHTGLGWAVCNGLRVALPKQASAGLTDSRMGADCASENPYSRSLPTYLREECRYIHTTYCLLSPPTSVRGRRREHASTRCALGIPAALLPPKRGPGTRARNERLAAAGAAWGATSLPCGPTGRS